MPAPNQPKTLKLVLKGEIEEKEIEITLDDGSFFCFTKKKKIIVPSKKGNQIVGFNSQTQTPFLTSSRKFKEWHSQHLDVFKKWRDKIELENLVRIPIVRAKLKIIFYFPNTIRRDLGNKAETIYDMLTDAGIIADDNFMVLNPITLLGYVKRDNPRTEVYLTIMEPNSPEYEYDLTDPSWEVERKQRILDRQRFRRKLKRQLNSK